MIQINGPNIFKILSPDHNFLSQSVSRVLSTLESRIDDHLSGLNVTIEIKRPTRSSNDANHISESIRSCIRWGLQILYVSKKICGLLHHFFTLTLIYFPRRFFFCCTFHILTDSLCYRAPYSAMLGLSSLKLKKFTQEQPSD